MSFEDNPGVNLLMVSVVRSSVGMPTQELRFSIIANWDKFLG
jgi:hypothetical protein